MILHSDKNFDKGSNPNKNQGLKNSPKGAKNSPKPIPSHFKRKAISRFLARQFQRTKDAQENNNFDEYITWAEDKCTALAKLDPTAPQICCCGKGA